MAFVIPVAMKGHPERGPQLLLIILTPDNLKRMKAGDPFDMQARSFPNQMELSQPLGNLDIVVAYEEDEEAIMAMAQKGDIPGIMARVERGRVHRPGDAAAPVSVKGKGWKH